MARHHPTAVATQTTTHAHPPHFLIPRPLRWPLGIYQYAFDLAVIGALASDIVAIIYQYGWANFWPHLISQIATLYDAFIAYPWIAWPLTVLLALLYAVSLRAAHEAQLDAQASNAQIAATVGADAGAEVADRKVHAATPQIANAATTGGAMGGFAGGYSGSLEGGYTGAFEGATEAVKRAVEAGRLIRAEVAPLPAGVVTTSGLPRPRELFGRNPQVEALLTALAAGGATNVCAVDGLPGIGKTALAAETVALAVERRIVPSAVWLSCEGKHGAEGLATIWSDLAGLLGETEITQLGDPNRQRAALHATLANPGRDKLLIALDNVEPDLPQDYADTLAQTLTGPQTALLLTARQALVSPLVRGFPLGVLDDEAARRLFVTQVQLRFPERPTADEAYALPGIITELGGLALAIQLTADYASVQRRSLPALLNQLRTEGVTGAGPLAKLKASIDRSWAILAPMQRLLFAGLSVLDGSSFPRAAALRAADAAVTLNTPTDKAVNEPGSDALDALVGLSLIEPLADDRMRLHPLLREYAADRLGELSFDTQDALGAAAYAYWLAYARQHSGLAGMNALEHEADGLMLALAWAHDHQRHNDTLALAKTLNTAWNVRGRRREELVIYQWCVEAADAMDDKHEQWWATHQLAVTRSQTGDIKGARAGYQKALQLAEELDDKASQALEWQSLGSLDIQVHEYARAREELNEALQLARQVEQPDHIVEAVWWLAELDRLEGNISSACAGFREALKIYVQLNHPDAEITRQRLEALGCG
ncbi:MAG: tetratricopeptide repeat protein [Ktedonobacterales bacterium]